MFKQSIRLALQLLLVVGFSAVHAGAYEDFFKAAKDDDGNAITQLLQRGFDPNSVDEKGQPALLIALREGSEKAATALLAHPQLQIDQANTAGETALMMAALRGRTAWLNRLLERGAAVNRPGWSALHYAATGPEPQAVALLLARGATLEARSPNGSTPLMMAARYGAEASVDLLLKAGADRQLRNERGLSAADFARDGGRAALSERLAAPGR